VKDAMEQAAAEDRRSVASLVEIVLSEYLTAKGF
jgi:hypothetical protein